MPAPTAFEQLMLELINAERAAAGAPPLAFDFQLGDAADAHSRWMISTDTFSHTGVGGSSPTARIQAAGYPLTGSWTTGENIALASVRPPSGLADEVLLLHQNLMDSSGHRANILNAGFREIGIGIEVGEHQGFQAALVTQNFARTGQAFFITGVAFDDLDGDRRYDVGEGLGGLTVTATSLSASLSTTTYGSGGYDLAVSPGAYSVTFSGPGYVSVTRQVVVGGANVKVDLIDPEAAFGQTATAASDRLQAIPGTTELRGGLGDDTILGSSGEDLLRGDEGNDAIDGGDAFDDLHGNMGFDTVSGGGGDDWVVGGKDDDLLSGDGGRDVVFGNIGADTCDGGAGDDLVRGGQDNDILRGGDGADWLSGDRGNDTITGGAGADIFHSFGDAGVDRIADFSRAQGDRVLLDAGTGYSVSQQGGDTVIDMTGGGRVVLVGIQMSALSDGWIVVG